MTAQLADTFNNPVHVSQSVTWSTTGLSGGFSQNPSATDVNGFTSVTFTTNVAVGSTSLIATTGSVTGQTSITSVAGAGAKYVLNASATTVGAGTTGINVTAQCTDANGNPVAGVRMVTFSTTGLPGTFTPTTTPTNAAGLATTSFTANTAVGTSTLHATDGTLSGNGPVITITPAPASRYVVQANNPTPVAGAAVTLSAQLTDQTATRWRRAAAR